MDNTEKVLILLIIVIFAFLIFAALTSYAEVSIMQKGEYEFYKIGDIEVRLSKTTVRADVYINGEFLFHVHTQDRFVINEVIGVHHKAFDDGVQQGAKQLGESLRRSVLGKG